MNSARDRQKTLRARNIATFVGLAAAALLFYAITILRFGS